MCSKPKNNTSEMDSEIRSLNYAEKATKKEVFLEVLYFKRIKKPFYPPRCAAFTRKTDNINWNNIAASSNHKPKF